ncbi:NAD(P)-dependent oxidoreductase [Phreatobacter sp. AB_2022a]|uniref:NAD(P)-dependent oxidoreductase n=1 Tax=Phreatobacter sp. AB_2022a TaxID=3003134 RepID=UPI00228727E5|nr:NAD(P)-dependent oxidoreductase [Phreatobacter sp. AB_2022a]MCZ0734962.1 SAM-dependent methyltransferase [Phreatobacter sp. AB_2022a]
MIEATAERRDRIGPLAVLPLFWALGGRQALVAGGCDAAAWKAELLAAAGARVLVASEAPGDALSALAARWPDGAITLRDRGWDPACFEGMTIAVGAFAADAEAEGFRAAARAAGVPVNLVDRPALCDFSFGGIVNRSPLVVGIATDGAAPVFGQQVRSRIEALLPPGIAAWAAVAKSWRPRIMARDLPAAARRRLWSRFAAMALDGTGTPPDARDLDRLLAPDIATAPAGGRVILVGAGPGEPDLVTLKAARALLAADVIVHQGPCLSACLDLARREARRFDVGGANAGAIAALLARFARSGRETVLLIPGDARANPLAVAVSARLEVASVAVSVVAGVAEATHAQTPGAVPTPAAGAPRFGMPAGVAAAPFS